MLHAISYRIDLHEEKYFPMKTLFAAYNLGLATPILDSALHQDNTATFQWYNRPVLALHGSSMNVTQLIACEK